MKAWQLNSVAGELHLSDLLKPRPDTGSVLVRIEASPLMSYLQFYVEGKLDVYRMPDSDFTIGTDGVGIVEEVGLGVYHLTPGQRVILSPHFVARENVSEPAQALIGLTSIGPAENSRQALNNWANGTLVRIPRKENSHSTAK